MSLCGGSMWVPGWAGPWEGCMQCQSASCVAARQELQDGAGPCKSLGRALGHQSEGAREETVSEVQPTREG